MSNIIDFIKSNHEGKLPDGRILEYKYKISKDLVELSRMLVAMANSGGGLVVYGVKESKYIPVMKGVTDDFDSFRDLVSLAIKEYTIGVVANVINYTYDDKCIFVIEVDPAESTAYFYRSQTSPERQTAYNFKYDEKGILTFDAKEKMQYKRVFKYMTLEAFIVSLYCKSWRFFEPSKWNDRFEERFYCADYRISGADGNTPQLFATCVTRESDSEAAWKVYSNGNGLSLHCVQLELDMVTLRRYIRKSRLLFEERPVRYEKERRILGLHLKQNPDYEHFFVPFTREKYLNLLAIKREAYDYEQEVRLFVIEPNTKKPRNSYEKAEYRDIKIDWKDVIKRIRIDKNCTPACLLSIQQACFSVGIEPVFVGFSNVPGNIVPPKEAKCIDFVAFSIDDMPGSSKIIID